MRKVRFTKHQIIAVIKLAEERCLPGARYF